jgi:hypothetical protein
MLATAYCLRKGLDVDGREHWENYRLTARELIKTWVKPAVSALGRAAFAEQIQLISDEELAVLLDGYATAVLRRDDIERCKIRVADLRANSLVVGFQSVSMEQMAVFLVVVAMAEYDFDALVFLPPRLRQLRLQEMAGVVGWASDVLLRINAWLTTNRGFLFRCYAC